jgi:hypothetical protein
MYVLHIYIYIYIYIYVYTYIHTYIHIYIYTYIHIYYIITYICVIIIYILLYNSNNRAEELFSSLKAPRCFSESSRPHFSEVLQWAQDLTSVRCFSELKTGASVSSRPHSSEVLQWAQDRCFSELKTSLQWGASVSSRPLQLKTSLKALPWVLRLDFSCSAQELCSLRLTMRCPQPSPEDFV